MLCDGGLAAISSTFGSVLLCTEGHERVALSVLLVPCVDGFSGDCDMASLSLSVAASPTASALAEESTPAQGALLSAGAGITGGMVLPLPHLNTSLISGCRLY